MIDLTPYNVVWDSPSRDATGSMPIGNGDIGANVWIEAGGDLLILLSKVDAWDENGILLKLGRVRISLAPNPFEAGKPFKQVLDLRSATIEITTSDAVLRVWADANRSVLHVELQSQVPVTVSATLECWRDQPRQVKTQTGDVFKNLVGKNSDPYPTIISPDHIFPAEGKRLAWCHHNPPVENDGFLINMRLQGLGEYVEKMQHPLLGRAFGAGMKGDCFVSTDDRTLRAPAGTNRRVSIYPLAYQCENREQFQTRLRAEMADVDALPVNAARQEHAAWWAGFWDRSHLIVTSDDPAQAVHTHRITQAYILQRYLNAAGGRNGPIKHNGSIFTVGTPEDPDFRRWGAGFWFQNQRLIYWPMLATGDFDLMRPWLQMYRNSLDLQRHRTQTYFNHGGAHYPETIYFWGAEVSAHYGWTPFEQRTDPTAECAYLKYYWTGGVELSLMLLEYVRHTEDAQFSQEVFWPVCDATLEFFDRHYPRDSSGRIRFEPGQALETWHVATNPVPEIAGLGYLIGQLAQLPRSSEADEASAAVKYDPQARGRLMAELPPIPIGETDGRRVILPAETFDVKKNVETPEMYCVFPYRLYAFDKPDLQLARDTLAARFHVQHTCWHQDPIWMACLGMADEARESLILRVNPENHSDSRFPGFWNAFHDYIPDVDHAGVLQIALQMMLMQTDGEKITLLPAWPKQWNAAFKLHAPGRVVVEGEVRGGGLAGLKVVPEGARSRVQAHAGGNSG